MMGPKTSCHAQSDPVMSIVCSVLWFQCTKLASTQHSILQTFSFLIITTRAKSKSVQLAAQHEPFHTLAAFDGSLSLANKHLSPRIALLHYLLSAMYKFDSACPYTVQAIHST